MSLGLDLKGGVQLVLRVKTDEALTYTSEDAAERLRLALREKNFAGPTITVPGPTRIVVSGVPQATDSAFRALADDQSPKANGLDKPRAVITATSKDKKKSCTLKVGAESADKTSAFVAEGSDVFTVPKWSVDRLLVKVDDIKKK